MKPSDFVWIQIFKLSINAGAKERIARNFAIIGADRFSKNKYKGSVEKLITDCVTSAINESGVTHG